MSTGTEGAPAAPSKPERLWSRLLRPGFLLMHLVVALLFLATLQLGWWQWQRAEIRGWDAQNLSYAFQWPVYGLMGLWFYSRMMRIEVERDPDAGAPLKVVELYQAPRMDTTGDPELAAYNSYLAELNEKVLRQRRS